MTKAAVAFLLAGQIVKFGHENYELLKADGGVAVPILCLLGGIALGIYGVRCFMDAFSKA